MLVVLGIQCAAYQGHAQVSGSPDTTSVDKVHVDHADIVNGEIVGGHSYRYLNGDVELSQDSVYLYCDSARIIDDREVYALGNVIIQKGDSLEVYADTLLYFADTRQADLKGEVALIHGTQELWTTHLAYDLANDVARYDQPAQLLDDSTQLSSKRGVYWVDTKEALFIDSVIVIGEDFNMISDSLRYLAEVRVAKFIAPTWIIEGDSKIYCESGFYDMQAKKAEFRQNAKYTSADQQAWAEVIRYDGVSHEIILETNANFTGEDGTASGDTIIYNEQTGDTRIAGNGRFDNDRQHVASPVIMYNKETGVLNTQGRGSVSEGSQILTADVQNYDQNTGIGVMTGNVVIQDTSAHTVLEADHADIRKEDGYLKAYGDARPVLKSEVDNDTLYLSSDTLITFEAYDTLWQKSVSTDTVKVDSIVIDSMVIISTDSMRTDSMKGEFTVDTIRYMIGYHDVRIFRGTMQGLCDSISFNGNDSVFVMYGNPILWSDTTQFTADTILLFMENNALSRVLLKSNALIISSVQGIFFNQIRGRYINAKIDSNEIQSMHVVGNAESVYYAQDDEGAFIGVNRVVASEIFFEFEESRISQIRFTTEPSGTMTPMGQVDHANLRLEGFSWKDDIRPKMLAEIF